MVAGQASSLFSPPSDLASLENPSTLQLAQPAIHPGEPKFTRVSSATSLFLEESLQPLFVFNLFICHLANLSQTWKKVGHCQLLQSQAWKVSSYTCFPPGFLNKFQTEALESTSICMSQETSMSNAISVHQQQDGTGHCPQAARAQVCHRGVTPEHSNHWSHMLRFLFIKWIPLVQIIIRRKSPMDSII